jgi:hypothetical protein
MYNCQTLSNLCVCVIAPKGKDSLSTINEISLHKYHCVLKAGPSSNISLWIYLDKQHYFFSMLYDLKIQGVHLKTETSDKFTQIMCHDSYKTTLWNTTDLICVVTLHCFGYASANTVYSVVQNPYINPRFAIS